MGKMLGVGAVFGALHLVVLRLCEAVVVVDADLVVHIHRLLPLQRGRVPRGAGSSTTSRVSVAAPAGS